MKMYNILLQYSAIVGVFLVVVSVLSVVFIHWGSVQTVVAQAKTDKSTKGLTFSPLRSELNIAPGTSLDGILTVTNSTEKPMTVQMNAEAFSVINQQYDYAFTAESDEVRWVSFNHPEISLEPGKSESVTYTVGVPLSAEPGGRYISIFASTDSGLVSNGVESRQRVASLFYITVLGDVSRIGHLLSLSSPWFISGNGTWSATLQNTGTTHYRSRYNLQIKDLLLGGTASSMSGEALILPNTIRLVPDNLPAPFWPGLYKAIYNIGLGDNPAVTRTSLILYMPIWAIILVIAGATTLVYWLLHKRLIKKH